MERQLVRAFWFMPNQNVRKNDRAMVLAKKPEDKPHYHEVIVDMSVVRSFILSEDRSGIDIPASAVIYPFTRVEWVLAINLEYYMSRIVSPTRTPRRNAVVDRN